MHGTADSAWPARERGRAGRARVHGMTDEGVPYRLTPPCAHRVPPSGRRCHDEAPPLSRGLPRRRPTFIPPIRSLSRPPRPISWERDSRLDGDAIQPPRGRQDVVRRPTGVRGEATTLLRQRLSQHRPRGVAAMVRRRCGKGLAGHESTQPVGLGGRPRRS
ncbi:hypothetical protein ACWDRZ_27330 [Streptomyces sp. NPDC003509]